jgi:hypothetical protein
MLNIKGFGRKLSRPNRGKILSGKPEENHFSQNSMSLGRNWKELFPNTILQSYRDANQHVDKE